MRDLNSDNNGSKQLSIRPADSRAASAIAGISCRDLGYFCTEEQVQKRWSELDGKRERVFAAVYDETVIGYI